MSDKFEALSQPVGWTTQEELNDANGGVGWMFLSPMKQPDEIALYSQEYVTALREDAARWFNAFEKAVSAGARYEERIEALQQQAVKDGNRIAELERRQSTNGVSKLQSEVVRLRIDNAELQKKLAALPADWSKDSSLETWFPLTAEKLAELEQRLQQPIKLPRTYEITGEFSAVVMKAEKVRQAIRNAGFKVKGE
ncbi:hypothetical protein ABQ431_03740 [Serratia fonticola]|uniref:hypothetical protein n=1 Tax=Serratia fonticola TaxID=47917 RepID=UPI003AAA4AE4